MLNSVYLNVVLKKRQKKKKIQKDRKNIIIPSWFLLCHNFFVWQLGSEHTFISLQKIIYITIYNIANSKYYDFEYSLVHLNFLLSALTWSLYWMKCLIYFENSVVNWLSPPSYRSEHRSISLKMQQSWLVNMVPDWMSRSQEHVQVVHCLPYEEITSCLLW